MALHDRKTKILEHCETGKDTCDLKGAGKAQVIDTLRGHSLDLFPGKNDFPPIRSKMTGYEMKQCRLARTIRSNQRMSFSTCDAQVHAANDLGIPK